MVTYIIQSYDSVCAYVAFEKETPMYNQLSAIENSIKQLKGDDSFIDIEGGITSYLNSHDVYIHGDITYYAHGEHREFIPLFARDRKLKPNYLKDAYVIGWDYLHAGDEYLDLSDIISDIKNTVNAIWTNLI